jgi:hypothetical protein
MAVEATKTDVQHLYTSVHLWTPLDTSGHLCVGTRYLPLHVRWAIAPCDMTAAWDTADHSTLRPKASLGTTGVAGFCAEFCAPELEALLLDGWRRT